MINPFIYFLLFLKASLFSTGGFSNLPSLHQDLIANSWATESDFGQSIAIGQISPGPNGLWVISLGYLTYGLTGALLALIAITLPALLVLLVLAGYSRIEHQTWVQGAMRGVSLAVVGLLTLSRLDDPAPTWSRLERNAHSRRRVRLRTEPQSEYPDYLKPGWTGRIYFVPLTRLYELNCYCRSFNGTNCCSVGPVYSASGRIRRLFATCSRIWAVQPATRLAAKVGVNISPGSPTDDNTTAE